MRALPLLVLLGGCNMASDPYVPRAGLWEAKTSFVSLEGEGITPDRVAELRRSFAEPVVISFCLDGKPVEAGTVEKASGCRVTRVSDSGARVDRERRCMAKDGEVVIVSRGTQEPERYEYRNAWTSIDPKTKKPVVVVMRETARRTGECPPHAKPKT